MRYRLRTLLIWLATVLLVAAARADDGLADGMKKLTGTWEPIENILDGKKTPADILKEFQTIIKVDSYENRHKGQSDISGGLKVVAKQGNVFHLDLRPTSGLGKGKVVKCIVEFTDGGFRLCMPAEPDGERPTEFASKAGSRQVLRTYRRFSE